MSAGAPKTTGYWRDFLRHLGNDGHLPKDIRLERDRTLRMSTRSQFQKKGKKGRSK
jgi:hypothetical protein